MNSKFQFFKNKALERRFHLQLNSVEAEEICALLESILRDNSPKSDELEGEELVTQCLLHNDPETFVERQRAFADAMEQFGKLQGISFEPEHETYQDAEEEYAYLAIIANIYCKMLNTYEEA